MAESDKPPNLIVEKTDVGYREIDAIAAHVRALLMRIGTDTSQRNIRRQAVGARLSRSLDTCAFHTVDRRLVLSCFTPRLTIWSGVWQLPLKRLRFNRRRLQPNVPLFVCREDNRQCLGMDYPNLSIGFGGEKAVELATDLALLHLPYARPVCPDAAP